MLTRLLIAFFLFLPMNFALAETYYWVDENGKRHYGDRVTPQDSKRERKVIDERGFTVKTMPAESEDRAQRQKEAAAKAAEEKRAAEKERALRAEQAAYDRALLTSYEDVDQIKQVRDDRVSLMDAGLQVEVEAHTNNQARLKKLRGQEEQLLSKKKPVPEKLSKDIADVERRLRINERNILELKDQRSKVEEKYNADIERYIELQSAAN